MISGIILKKQVKQEEIFLLYSLSLSSVIFIM